MKSKNKIGPSIEPWGTPKSTFVKDDLIPFGNFTNCNNNDNNS